MTKKQDDLFSKPTEEVKRINEMIDEIKGASTTLAYRIHICAVSCVLHAVKHHNSTPAVSLCKSLSTGWRVRSLQFWFRDNGPFKFNKDGELEFKKEGNDNLKKLLNEDEQKFVKTRLTEPIWADRSNKDEKPFDFGRALKKLIDRAEKKKGKEGSKVDGLDHFKKLVDEAYTFKPKQPSRYQPPQGFLLFLKPKKEANGEAQPTVN